MKLSIAIIQPEGRIDLLTAGAMRQQVAQTVAGGAPRVVIDLAGVTFMDSRGLGALLAANERSREGAPTVSIYRPSEAVVRLLDVSGVRGVLAEVEELPAA